MEKEFNKKNDELKIKKKKNFKNELFKKKKVVKRAEDNSPKDDYIVKPLSNVDASRTQRIEIPNVEVPNLHDERNVGRKKISIKKKKGKKIGWKIFRVCIFLFIALLIIGGGIAFGVLTGIIEDTEQIAAEDLVLKENSIMYSSDGTEIAQLVGAENREIVSYTDIPKHVVDAVVAIEDERFFEHNGVDLKRTVGAIFNYIIHFGKSDFGGSTITQQLVKNTTDDRETSWTRKVREWYRAIALEEELGENAKEKIMEQYLNTIFLGEGSYGIEKAAETYFGKRITDVSIAEAAVLASLIQAPSAYNPYGSEEARAALINRQHVVLSQMLKLEKITEEQYNEAMSAELRFTKDYQDNNNKSVLSYFADAVITEVASDLAESKGIPYNTAIQLLYTAGYKIYTTQDLNVQKAIDDAYNNGNLFYADDGDGAFMDSTMVVMDQKTGNVLGLKGSALPKTTDRAWNGATQSKNQPGSTMKILGAYGPAFELGVSSPGSGVDDSYFELNGWVPENYYGYYNGYVTVRNAIARSMNIPAIRTTQKAGVDYSWTFAKNCGLTSLVEADKNLASVAIGGLTNGVTTLEMCNAYATIANEGVWVEPKLYTKVVDKDGNVILNKESEVKRVMKDSTAYMLTDCLKSVTGPGGTAYGYVNIPGIECGGKTGETDGMADQWFVGFTPYYTIACWNGYNDETNKSLGYHKSIGYRRYLGDYPYTSIVLFQDVMSKICEGKPAAGFNRPDSVITAEVCKVSGLVATDACRNDVRGNQAGYDLFARGSVPTATCTIHKIVKVCDATGKLAGQYCQKTSDKSFITRDNVASIRIKTSDWSAMIPTETCTTCTKPVETPKTTTTTDKDKTTNSGTNKDKDKDVNIYQ